MAEDVWTSGDTGEAPTRALPSISALVNEAFADVQSAPGPYLLAGTGAGGVILVWTLVGVTILVATTLGGTMLGGAIGDPDTVGPIVLLATLVGTLVFLVPLALVSPPLSASLARAVWDWQTNGVPLDLGAAFREPWRDLGKIYGVGVSAGLVVLVGLLLCYLPGLFAMLLLHHAFYRVAIHGRTPGEALSDTVAHVLAHPQWNLGVFGVSFLISLIASNVPLLGVPLTLAGVAAWNIRCYRAAFPEPRAAD